MPSEIFPKIGHHLLSGRRKDSVNTFKDSVNIFKYE